MSRRNRRYGDFNLSFIDMLMAFIGTCAIMMLFAFALMSLKTSDEGVIRKAEYIATITWDDGRDCDVDFWMRDPQNRIVSYKTRTNGLMALERDDLGYAGDLANAVADLVNSMTGDKKPKTNPDQYNEETIVLRGTNDGTYFVSVFLYSCRVIENGERVKIPLTSTVDLDVELKIMQINPYKIVYTKTVKLTKIAQEVSIVEFDMDADKKITRFADTPVKIVDKDINVLQ